ncbi:MAG: L-ribulose-5-phosphate 4-epimerase AraD [Verrucomicrobiae bacterium]|nr:L-ribulose-5-phosphate 4-epimerase AraD [Verrucomicrobiae bacterium]
MLEELKERVAEANRQLGPSGLVKLTWGNVSEIDRASGIVGIKPSGVDYACLKASDIVLVDLDGNRIEGTLNPSSDTKTHLHLYRSWPDIGGVTHTHSPFATAFSQAGRPLPCLGTTHADHFYGTVPVCRALTSEEVADDYEHNTGVAIVEHFARESIDPMQMPAVLQHYHAPFTWGKSGLDSIHNSIALEMCAQMALSTVQLAPDTAPLPSHLLDKHYLRKHGPGAYYGQGGKAGH